MSSTENEIKLGELVVDTLTLEVRLDDELIELEPKWVKVLIALASEPNKVLTRKQIIEQVWSDYLVGEDSLNRAISKLRKAIEPVAGLEIKTARGVGYQLSHEITPSVSSGKMKFGSKTLWPTLGVVVLVLVITLLMIRSNDAEPAIMQPPYQTHITSDLGIEYSPDISPNNKFMAYTWNGGKGSQWNIYIKQIGLEGSKRLTTGRGSDQSASWSNAGDKLAYFSNQGNSWSLSIKSFLGTEERSLLKVRSIWKTASAITWARDDNSLVFSAMKQGDTKHTLNRLDLDDLSVTELKGEKEWDYTLPKFSPDHSMIATVAHRGVRHYLKDALDSIIGRLQVIEVATGKVVFERSLKEEIASIDWTSNAGLIFTMGGGTICRIYELSLDGNPTGFIDLDKVLPVLTIPDVVRSFTYHRASKDLYLERWRADVNIWKAKYSNGEITENERELGSTLFDFNPKLTPDESQLAYISDKSNEPQIWLYNLASNTSRQITNHKQFVQINSIDWSGDGSKMLVSMKKGKQDSYASIIDTLGNEIHRIDRANGVYRPVWSGDDETIYAVLYDTRDTPAIWQYAINTQQWEKFTDAPSVYVRVIDDYLYYMKQNIRGLWRAPASSPDQEELVTKRLPKARADYWTVHGDTLKMINLDFEKSFLEMVHIPSQKLLSSSQINNYIPYGQAGASFTKDNEIYFSSIDNYDADITKIRLPALSEGSD